ncbi:MAG: ABC transporter substrate-binding protein [Elusimicrobiota bacterium]
MKRSIAAALALLLAACSQGGAPKPGEKVLEIGAVAVAGSSDPNNLNSMYDLDLANLVYDTLYEYEYLVRPYKLKPAMAEGMPQISKDGLTYTIKLKKGLFYADDKCFAERGGRGREAVVGDFIFNLKRKADAGSRSTNWWLVNSRIAGLNELRQKYQGRDFDYDAEVEGLKALDDHTLQITLTKPFPQIMWILAMAGMALYPPECARFYGQDFANHPVGTGPFRMVEWQKNARYILTRNEKYREDLYPAKGEEEDKAAGRLADAGKRLPFADRLIVHEFSQSQPYWLQFRAGKFAFSRVPGEASEEVFRIEKRVGNRRVWQRGAGGHRVLTEKFAAKNAYYPLPLIDFVYRGFNYEDPVIGGEKGRKVRQALQLAHDIGENNDLFYNGLNKIYAGIIPPGVYDFDPRVKSPYHGPDIKRAKELLAEAGYPGGAGLEPLKLCGGESAASMNIATHFIGAAKKLGVKVIYDASRFAELSKKIKERRCQMMGLAWGADWPDAQNFIQLMYGPNKSPGSNGTNYDNPVVNRLYERAAVMPEGPERHKIFQEINRIVIEDVPFTGSMARTRDYLIPHGTLNFKPEEMIHNHAKYIRLKKWDE